MTVSGDGHAERRRQSGRPSDDLETIEANPSLRPLVGSGWRLDRLPVTSTGCAFVAALASSLAVVSFASAVLVTLAMTAGLAFTAVLLAERDVGAARVALRTTRMVLVTWLMTSAILAAATHPAGDARAVPTPKPTKTTKTSAAGASCSPATFSYRSPATSLPVCPTPH